MDALSGKTFLDKLTTDVLGVVCVGFCALSNNNVNGTTNSHIYIVACI